MAHNGTENDCNRWFFTYLLQTHWQSTTNCQPLHTLEHGVLLLSTKQRRKCQRTAVCVHASEGDFLWPECLSGNCFSNQGIFWPSTLYGKGLHVVIHL
jgi:hypothetical protein